MELSKKAKQSIFILLAITLVIVVFHVSKWERVPLQTLIVEMNGTKKEISFSELPLTQVRGTQMTAKGEKRTIDAQGCSLRQVLTESLGTSPDAAKVTVFAGDGFHAEVTAKEWEQPDQVYLILREDGTLQLLVLGDSDSRRNVKDVERLVAE